MPSPQPPTPFTTQDLNSNDGFLTYVWGPGFWMTLHTISMNYPTHPTSAQRSQYRVFFNSLRHVLPCGKCRDNLVDNLATTRYGARVFKNRDTLSRWVYDLHKCVNTMLGKPTKVSYEEMRQTYEHFRARCGMTQSAKPGRTIRANTMIGGARSSKTKNNTKIKNNTKSQHTAPQGHSGCTVPVTGVKSKCLLRIVPVASRSKTMRVDKRCLCRMSKCCV